MTLGFIVGAVFGAWVAFVAAWLFHRNRLAVDHAHVLAIARHEGAQAAREAVARLVLQRRSTPPLPPATPADERPTRVR